MATEVEICNLALSHLGDAAVVASINPPDSSVQAARCAQFYPIARDSLLEAHTWGFASRRQVLTLLAQPTTTQQTTTDAYGNTVTVSITQTIVPNSGGTPSPWKYIYAAPNGVVRYLAVLDQAAEDDNSSKVPLAITFPQSTNNKQGIYTPQEFIVEADSLGNPLIYTNQPNAMLRYTAQITDPNKFTPLFRVALSYFLASYLAGPTVKGQEGIQVAASMLQIAQGVMAQAAASDANQRRLEVTQSVSWMVNR